MFRVSATGGGSGVAARCSASCGDRPKLINIFSVPGHKRHSSSPPNLTFFQNRSECGHPDPSVIGTREPLDTRKPSLEIQPLGPFGPNF
jgi:hypothetical protein